MRQHRSARARRATVAGLGLLAFGGAAAQAMSAEETPIAASGLAVTVADGRLSVRVGEAPLDLVLEAIAAQTEVAITVRGDPGPVRPQAFADLPLDAGIRRLADERRLLMFFRDAGDWGAAPRLTAVRVYGDLPSDEPARLRHPLTRTLGRLAAEARPLAPAPPGYEALAKKDKGERLGAIRGLARQQDEAAIETLGTLLAQDPDATVRRIAATALGNIGGEAAAAALEPALADADVEVRIRAMRGLHVVDPEAAAAALGELALRDADPGLRRQAVHLLATLRSPEARATIELAASDPDDAVREAAEESLTRPPGWR
ncbi:MAG: HEAT repeat domain-containing protein [Geminicoccaceae bacterium]